MKTRALETTVRSLYYRRRLARGIPKIEGTIRVELLSRGLSAARCGGFLISIDGNNLTVEQPPAISPGQLPLPRMK